MNYMKQLNEFYPTLDYKPLSANAIAIYVNLLHIANKTGWIDEFKVANSILMSKCKLSISSLQRARNELIVQEYIYYKKGLNQNDAPKYKIKKLYFEQADEQASEQPNEQASEQADEQATEHINKQNKTKQKNKENKKEKLTELDMVIKEKIQDKELKDAFYNFIKMRKAIKKPMTNRGLELAIDRVNKLSKVKEEQLLIINKSIMNNWQGLFALNDEDKKQLKQQEEYKESKMSEEEYYKKHGGKNYV